MALLPALLAACSGSIGSNPAPATLNETASNAATSEDYRLGAGHFNRGEYGLAEQYFRQGTDKAPQDAASWIGLAATYDQLRRFDLADRAYRTAIKLSGETAQILNNQGYSYMLRGNLAAARAKFMQARALDPDNPTLINNMKLLDDSAKYMKANAL